MQFTEKDIMTDLLLGTKSMSTSYHQGVLEAANDRVRNTLIQINNEELNFQKQIFDIMHDRGWYQVQPANMTTAAQARTTTTVPQQMTVRENFMEQRPY